MTDHNTIALALSVRLRRIIRLPNGWRLWLDTEDFKLGTYLELHDDGRLIRYTERVCSMELNQVRPSDAEIRKEYEDECV